MSWTDKWDVKQDRTFGYRIMHNCRPRNKKEGIWGGWLIASLAKNYEPTVCVHCKTVIPEEVKFLFELVK